jgi:hypothetical protein
MPKPKTRAVGKPIRPRPTKPVLYGRVEPKLLEKIKRAAKKSGRTLSEELAYRAAVTFDERLDFLVNYLQRRDAEIEGDLHILEARVRAMQEGKILTGELEPGETLADVAKTGVKDPIGQVLNRKREPRS